MSLMIYTSDNAFKKVIKKEFNLLLNLFDFDPNTIPPYKIEITIIDSLEEFLLKFDLKHFQLLLS